MSESGRSDDDWMRRALDAAEGVRGRTAPNPWVGAVVVPAAGRGAGWFASATAPPGGPHAEAAALAAAGPKSESATLYVTLEPCAHQGRTPPCTGAIIRSGIRRVVVAIEDPDPQVSGRGVAALRAAGIDVDVGVEEARAAEQLAAYLTHRRTGRPFVVLKLAASLDGRTAAPDGSSRWITGPAARHDAHRLRAQSDAVLVAGTIRSDDPALTVRLPPEDPYFRSPADQPVRVVLGRAPAGAAVQPALEFTGDLGKVLDQLGSLGIVQLLVEGGATVAHAFHRSGLVDRYVLYLAPALFGGDDARPLFAGRGAPTMEGLWRGRVLSVTSLESDLRVELSADDG
jgi:diaminohydroxyphosphoribosylaminopyrimidine deaminase / 5-amino-6-(5-phosphoribosylamino)uracil reductase